MPKKEEVDQAPVSAADVFVTFIDDLVQNHTITADVGGIVKHAINRSRGKLEASLKAV